MRYYIIAGEASGDLHGSYLINNIKELDPQANIRAWGGDKMAGAGATIVKHYRDLAFMGFVEVVKHLPTIFKNIKFCKEDVTAFRPDVVVFIDYPGFNLRIAKWAHKQGLKTAYYISPQVWAWKENRVKAIKRDIDKMLVVLPFEVNFYKKWDYPVTYVGHPLIQVVKDEAEKPLKILSDKKIIALLPGSRQQEIALKLPIMLSVVNHYPDYQFIVAQAPSLPSSFYKSILGDAPVKLTDAGSYNLLRQSTAALVTSGTATLETALFMVPEVVCYKGNALSYQIARRLIRVKYISLVNLIMDTPVVEELIQNDLNTAQLITALDKILSPDHAATLRTSYLELYHKLGPQNAPLIAAGQIVALATSA